MTSDAARSGKTIASTANQKCAEPLKLCFAVIGYITGF